MTLTAKITSKGPITVPNQASQSIFQEKLHVDSWIAIRKQEYFNKRAVTSGRL